MSTETLSTNMAGRPLRDGSKWGLEAPAVYSISKIGMWLFLATEIMLFAMLFTGYAIYYYRNPDAFHESAKALNTTFGAVNTVILLLSSFTVAWAIEAIKKSQRELCNVLLIITITLGVVFLVNKYFEYAHEIHIGNLIPSNLGTGEPVVPTMFFFLYFVMTGVHGLHIVIGLGLLFWVLAKNMNGDFHSGWYTPVEIGGLYWHLVDLIWIYLFPLLYLVA